MLPLSSDFLSSLVWVYYRKYLPLLFIYLKSWTSTSSEERLSPVSVQFSCFRHFSLLFPRIYSFRSGVFWPQRGSQLTAYSLFGILRSFGCHLLSVIVARLRSDAIVCPLVDILVFGVHCSPVFTAHLRSSLDVDDSIRLGTLASLSRPTIKKATTLAVLFQTSNALLRAQ